MDLYREAGDHASSSRHRELGASAVLRLADSLDDDEPVRAQFLAAGPVRGLLGPAMR